MTNIDRYLKNPHITLDNKRRKQLGLDHNMIEANGPAIELPAIEPQVRQEVVVRKKRYRTDDQEPWEEDYVEEDV